jgi:hypothetical protein
MKLGTGRLRRHPDARSLALYATGDLSSWMRVYIRLHILRCPRCASEVRTYASSRQELKARAGAGTLTAFENRIDWSTVEREMLGNIAVGVAAARCIDKVGRQRTLVSGTVWLTAALVVLFVLGWWTHIPREQTTRLVSSLAKFAGLQHASTNNPLVRSTEEGISVRTENATLVLRNPRTALVRAMGNSAVEARYVDDNTGQVTITNVYVQ